MKNETGDGRTGDDGGVTSGVGGRKESEVGGVGRP